MTTRDADLFLDVAEKIARRLIASAIWNGDDCTWRVTAANESGGRLITREVLAAGSIYDGSAGIALFLAESWRLFGGRDLLRTARGALNHAIRNSHSAMSKIGLYEGSVGVAYSAARFANLTGDDEMGEHARSTMRQCRRDLPSARRWDVISGTAGAVLALLDAPRSIVGEEALLAAVEAGAHLEEQAVPRPYGWSWSAGDTVARQDLCGYAHGASGSAHAFLELFAATGDVRWRHAAVRAMQYEEYHQMLQRSSAPSSGDWPGYMERTAFGVTGFAEIGDELRTRIRHGFSPARAPVAFPRSWCHGAPGIGLVRLRAETLCVDTGVTSIRAQESLDCTADGLGEMASRGYSLCHGVIGNVEVLLHAARRTGRAYMQLVLETATTCVEAFELATRPWPSGTVGCTPEPSLMLGDAGIGHFLLQLADPTVPSVTFLSTWRFPSRVDASVEFRYRVRDALGFLNEYEAIATRIDSHLEVRTGSAVVSGADTPDQVLTALETAIARLEDSDVREKLADALAPEAMYIRESALFDDHVGQLIEEMSSIKSDEIDWREALFTLRSTARLVRTRFAWRAWIAGEDKVLAERTETYAIHRRGREVMLQSVSPFGAAVLEAIHELGSSATEIEARLTAIMDSNSPSPENLSVAIQDTIRESVDAGMLQVCRTQRAG